MRVDEELGAQDHDELAHVHFGDEDFFVALEHVAEVAGERVQVAQMHVADFAAFFALGVHGGGDGTVGGTPGDDQKIAGGIAFRNYFGNILGDAGNFFGSGADHVFVIQRLVVDVAGDVLLFDAADAMFEAGGTGDGPGARESIGIPLVRLEADGIGFVRHWKFGQVFDVRNFPGFSAVGEVAVRKNNHRDHVLDGNATGFERDPETIASGGRCENGNRRFGVAAEEGLEQVGLFGFGGQAGRRAAALDVANDERQFDGDGEAECFGFQGHAGAGSGGDAERAGIRRADGGSDGGDFVFGLKSGDAEILVLRKLMQDVRRGGDGIRTQEQFDARLLRGGDETEGERGVAADITVGARFQLRGRNFVADLKGFGSFAVAVARFHGERIGLDQVGLVLKFVVQVAKGGLHGAVVEPVAHAEGEEILAAVHAFGIEAEVLQRAASELGQFDRKEAIGVERMIFERADFYLSLTQIVFLEVVEVDDQDAVGFEVREIHFQRGGIHGDQDIDAVAGGVHVVRRKVNLESADSG